MFNMRKVIERREREMRTTDRCLTLKYSVAICRKSTFIKFITNLSSGAGHLASQASSLMALESNCAPIRVHACMDTNSHIHTHAQMHTCTDTCAHTYTCTHARVYTDTYPHTQQALHKYSRNDTQTHRPASRPHTNVCVCVHVHS